MDKEKLQKIKSIFNEALNLDYPELELFLNLKCGDDTELKNEVLSLFNSMEKSDDFLESPLQKTDSLKEELEDSFIGRQIGNFLIDGQAGVGGMGIVYSGKRNDKEFEQKVAIKILKYGLPSDYLLKRFQIERQTLANLQHPNIARLIDGGKTSDGLPYLVMEFIDGIPITEYCDQKNLSIDSRLKLFREVCSAVQYAHQNLVVHRDIKPGNILVTPDGIPKLLDFGVAKLLNEDLADLTEGLTKAGIWHMTPEFASPEQIKGDKITTASDIYSLGVLLYQILTGHQPYRITSISPVAISKIITEENILKPSDAVKKTEEIKSNDGKIKTVTPEDIGRKRNQKPERLFNHLRGDLDNIIMKAMHKDPLRRYVSVEQFSEDIRRHLVGLPVNARKDTAVYLLTKFFQRHKAGVITSTIFILFLITSLFIIIWQANLAADERDKVKIEAKKVESVNNFLQNMLSSADPTEIGRDVKVYDVLKKASSDVETDLKNQPQIEAEIRRTLGLTFMNLGEFDQAKIHLDKALNLDEKIYGKQSKETAQNLHDLALYYHWIGKYELADSIYGISLNIFRSSLKEPNQGFSDCLDDYGILKNDLGDYNGAEKLIREALTISENINGKESYDVASILNNLALTLHYLKNLKEAEKYYLQSLDLRIKLMGENRPEVATAYNNLAFVYIDKNQPEIAKEYFQKSYELKLKLLGKDHPEVGFALNNLGTIEFRLKNYKTAKEYFLRAIEQYKTSLPPEHAWFGTSYYWLGKTLIELNDYKNAETDLRKSLKIRKSVLLESHYLIGFSEGELGICLLNLADLMRLKIY